MSARPLYLDVSDLPRHAFGSRGLMWWATVGFMVIEGTMFAMLIATALYLRGTEATWPPHGFAPPALVWGTLNLAVLVASILPNHWLRTAAHELDLQATRRWILVSVAVSVVFLTLRGIEFTELRVRWDDGAYGSILWVTLGFHTLHLLTDAAETAVLAFLMWKNPSAERFVDVSEDCLYWNFVVAAWLPLYVVLYLLPRWA